MVQLTCPDASRWEALLADAASRDEATELEAHLSSCSHCRGLLDDLAVGSSGWLRDASRLAASTDHDPALTRTLHRLLDTPVEDDHGIPPISLEFLTPSDQPGVLGTLGRYHVLAVLGRGAFGIVLKALDSDLLRPVAIKVLAPYLAPSGTARKRFLREARAAAAVSHDHIVTIHGVVEQAALPYLVMEYVTGVSLQSRLDQDGPLRPIEIARIGMQAAQGLAAAHEQGLVHRDIKPANILLENGVERVKLTDFGLARAADDARLTQSGVAAGTPLYMSPEQARGDTIDQRSDLFSLGSVLYALATGFPPFRAGSTMGVLNRITNEPPRPIRETIPDFPAGLEAIIMQLLEKDPSKRFQLAADVSFRLTAYLNNPQPEPPKEQDPPPQLERRQTQKWWHGALAMLGALLVVAVVLTFKTPKGTLIVEVDDPAVEVQLNGDELTITGAGVYEVRLKPGTYELTALKDGKQVKHEIVTIKKNGKQVVKITLEPPALPPAVPFPVPPVEKKKTIDPDGDALLDARLKSIFPDGKADRLDLMRRALREKRAGVAPVHSAKDGPVPQTHPSYPKLQSLVAEAAKAVIDPFRLDAILPEAEQLAGLILRDTEDSKAAMRLKQAGRSEGDWEQRQEKLVNDYQVLVSRLVKTETGRVLLVTGPGTDLDKFMVPLSAQETIHAKRLLVLRDQFGVLVQKAEKELDRWEKAGLEFKNRDQRFRAGLISENDYEAARLDVKQAERALKTVEDAMAAIIADVKKLADELRAPAADAPAPDPLETEFKKVMAEFDAIALRIAKDPVGRLLATIPPYMGWGDAELQNALGPDKAKVDQGRRLLTFRDLILKQARQAEDSLTLRVNLRMRMKDESPSNNVNDMELNRKAEQDLRFRTATIRGIVDDLKKLADEIDPPAKKVAADPLPADPKARLNELRSRLNSIEKVEKDLGDMTHRRKEKEAELQRIEADLKTTPVGKTADALKDKIDTAQKSLKQMSYGMDQLKSLLAEFTVSYGQKAEIVKEIDRLQKVAEGK
jgi:hypothetical protein